MHCNENVSMKKTISLYKEHKSREENNKLIETILLVNLRILKFISVIDLYHKT